MTAVISEAQLKEVAGFEPNGSLVVSLYLNVDGAKRPRLQDYEKELHSLINRARHEWFTGDGGVDKEKKRALTKDLDRVQEFITGEWRRQGVKGLVVFSCADGGFWHVFELPVGVPSALIVGAEPYAKTLTALLDEYKRYCVVGVDRKRVRFFTVFLGEIEEHHGVFVDDMVPDQVKEGEWAGLRQSRIARHIEDHVMHHLKDSAGLAFNFFLQHGFDRLILAGHKELFSKFKATLHPYLQERLVGEFSIDPDAPLTEILKKSLLVEAKVQKREEESLVAKLREESHAGGLGVTGLKPTIEALMRGQAHILLVGDGYEERGFICYRDRYLTVEAGDCPICGAPLNLADDIVEDIVQVAIDQNVRIEHISHVGDLTEREKVGALLRFAV